MAESSLSPGEAPHGSANVLYMGLPNEHDREFIASVVQAVHALVIVVDHTGEIVWFNRACEETSGYSADEVRGKKLWDVLLLDEDRPMSSDRLDAIVAGAPIQPRIARWKTRDGDIRHISFSTGIMHDRHGAVRYLIATGIDITETRRIELALRRSEELLQEKEQLTRSILHSLTVHIAVLDAQGVIVSVNKAWNDFGRDIDRSRPEVGVNYLERCRIEGEKGYQSAQDAFEGISSVINGELSQFSMVYSTHFPSEIRWFMMNVTALHGGGGAVMAHHDITDRRNAEDALREVNSVLEGRVEERTADIRSMIEQLKEANHLQKRFIADASHELRTPLTIIQAELDLLAPMKSFDAGTREALDRISGESRRLANLANDLLLLAKGDANQFGAGRPARVDEMVLDCISQLRTLAANKGITWRIEADEPVEIHCNVPSVSRAFTNLMENAIKYSPKGSIVKLMLERRGEVVAIEVRDSGPGIPSDDLPRIFDRFYRSDLARSAGGFGLGLSIVKAIIEAHGGTVAIESKLGVGTTARIELPLRPVTIGAPTETG